MFNHRMVRRNVSTDPIHTTGTSSKQHHHYQNDNSSTTDHAGNNPQQQNQAQHHLLPLQHHQHLHQHQHQHQQRPVTRSISSILSDESIILDGNKNSNNNNNMSHSNHHHTNRKGLLKSSKYTGTATLTTVTTAQLRYTKRTMLSFLLLIVFVIYFITTIYYTRILFVQTTTTAAQQQQEEQQQQQRRQIGEHPQQEIQHLSGFDSILDRAQQHTKMCTELQSKSQFLGFDTRSELPFHNDTVASLPAFGIVSAIQSYKNKKHSSAIYSNYQMCEMPPLQECAETQLSVVFMAYNPDRLGITLTEIKRMLDPNIFHDLIKEIVLVWNGNRHIDESSDGRALLDYMKDRPIRIVYPLQMGFPNDLMNRYHPNIVQPTTKALLYYDDDGPFYSYHAIQGGFELWKRHAQAQIGAMARQIIFSPRQQEYKLSLLGSETTKKSKPADNVFVSHCTNVDDQVDYEFHFFANYDANMVLPSGSMLHSNYLCYLWHPIFEEIRQFVLLHPVHPDDMTVSMIVSQLAGVAPRVYSRKLDRAMPTTKNSKEEKRYHRRLVEDVVFDEDNVYDNMDFENRHVESDLQGIVPFSEIQRRRSLMFSICWDCGSGMTEMKQYWAELRTEAVNSLVRYFGSLNSGSIGWCTQDSEHYNPKRDGRCWPTMAKQGMLPWMNPDGTPKDTCP